MCYISAGAGNSAAQCNIGHTGLGAKRTYLKVNTTHGVKVFFVSMLTREMYRFLLCWQ